MVRLEMPAGPSKVTTSPTTLGPTWFCQPVFSGGTGAGRFVVASQSGWVAGPGVPPATGAGSVGGVQDEAAGSDATQRPSKQNVPASQSAEDSQEPSLEGQPAAASSSAERADAAAFERSVEFTGVILSHRACAESSPTRACAAQPGPNP